MGETENKNRAHALEGDARKAKMLWLPELSPLFDYVEEVLEDLSIVSAGAAFGGDNMNHADFQQTAEDLVDLIMLGNIRDVRYFTSSRTRDELYARLHEIDDGDPYEDGDTPRIHFNDRQYGPPFEDCWPNAVAAAC